MRRSGNDDAADAGSLATRNTALYGKDGRVIVILMARVGQIEGPPLLPLREKVAGAAGRMRGRGASRGFGS